MPANMDHQLDILLSELYNIQKDVGGPEGDKPAKKKGGEKEDKFNMLKTQIIAKLGATCDMLSKEPSSKDPKAVIQRNQDIRTNLRALEEEWKEMDGVYQHERGKRRSKLTQEEMEARRQLLVDIRHEIGELKGIFQAGVVGASARPAYYGGAGGPSEGFSRKDSRAGGAAVQDARPAGQLTQEQQFRVQQIRDRQAEMEDKYLSVVEESVARLGDVARSINEELILQDRMVDDLGNRVDTAQEHVKNVNTRMKEVLKEVRSADKFCVDVMCILMLLGMVAVLYALIKSN